MKIGPNTDLSRYLSAEPSRPIPRSTMPPLTDAQLVDDADIQRPSRPVEAAGPKSETLRVAVMIAKQTVYEHNSTIIEPSEECGCGKCQLSHAVLALAVPAPPADTAPMPDTLECSHCGGVLICVDCDRAAIVQPPADTREPSPLHNPEIFVAEYEDARESNRCLSKKEWIKRYGGQELIDSEGFEVVPCVKCDDHICHGWKVQRKPAEPVREFRIADMDADTSAAEGTK